MEHALVVTKPWLSAYPEGVAATIDEGALKTLKEIIEESVARHEAREAFESFGVTRTYGEIGASARALAGWFQANGFEKGDRIALMMPNVMAYPISLFAVLIGGFTVVNVNPLYTARELIHQLNDSGATGLVVLENFAHVAAEALPATKVRKVLIAAAGDGLGLKGHLINFVARNIKKVVPPYALPGALRLPEALKAGATAGYKPVTVTRDDVAFLQYTGGTTGVAKGATLLHRNVSANVTQTSTWFAPLVKESHQEIMVTALPLYHIFALTCCGLYMTAIGGKCLLIANPRDIPGFVKTLQGAKFTMVAALNTLVNALTNHPDIGKVDFSRLSLTVCGGMAMQGPVARRWQEITGCPVLEGYGLSETSPVVATNPWNVSEFTGTIGYPWPSTDIQIRDAAGAVLPPLEPGELCVKGPQVMAGYWQRPDETAKAMTADGYFRTGDIAMFLTDGQIKIVDRLKDMVLVSGFNVYPNEVEEVIAAHPGVLEVAVIGLPDTHSGEAVAAYVVRKDPALSVEALRAHCRSQLTAYKVPKHIVFRESLPKTNVGKVLRRALRDEVIAA